MSTPYLNKLENEFLELKKQYEYLITVENDEYKEAVNQIELSHNRELSYIKKKLEQVTSYKNNLVNEIKLQLENSIVNCNNRFRIINDETMKNHNKIIKGYELKISETQTKLELDKTKYLDSIIYPTFVDAINYNNQLAESEYNGALSNYRNLIDTLKIRSESEKIESQRQVQTLVNNFNIEFNKNIDILDIEYRNFKLQNDTRLKEEENIKLNRLNEIEKNRQSVLSDYQTAKLNSQKQFENDIINFEAKLSSLEQEIEKNNASKTQNIMKTNSEILKSIAIVENSLEKQINASKVVMEKNLKNIN
jgi:hypothetical protein